MYVVCVCLYKFTPIWEWNKKEIYKNIVIYKALSRNFGAAITKFDFYLLNKWKLLKIMIFKSRNSVLFLEALISRKILQKYIYCVRNWFYFWN